MSSQKPIIGILCDINKEKKDRPLYFVKSNYVSAINDAGGVPFLIPPTGNNNDLTQIANIINGLLVPGGDDIDPKYFDEGPHPSVVLMDPEIIQFQMEFCHHAMNKDMPVLGICAGHQIINIACGGNIYQDIPSQYSSKVKHKKDKNEKQDVFHTIKIDKNTMLGNMLQTDKIIVNSTHHQALKNIAEGFTVTARSEDGIVEAIEDLKHRFVLGVQCHPEDMYKKNKLFLNLFQKLIHEASRDL